MASQVGLPAAHLPKGGRRLQQLERNLRLQGCCFRVKCHRSFRFLIQHIYCYIAVACALRLAYAVVTDKSTAHQLTSPNKGTTSLRCRYQARVGANRLPHTMV